MAHRGRPDTEQRPPPGKVSPVFDDHDNTTVQGGVPGPWNERLPHFRFDETPGYGDEIQSEYFVAREDGLGASRPRADGGPFAPHLLTSEIRTVAADDLWLSPAHGRDSLTIHFTWKKRPERSASSCHRSKTPCGRSRPVPIGGNGSPCTPRRSPPTTRAADFIELARELDPDGQFRNVYLARNLGLN
jgi:alditol oxidase